MSKFKKKTKTSQEIPTSALPDIIFMLLFFFMVTTVLRETDMQVSTILPQAHQLQKLEKKSLITHMYVGPPKDTGKFGKEPRIQMNDNIVTVDELPTLVMQARNNLPESDRDKMTVSLKIDQEAKMGLVIDIRQKLRDVNALKVNYAASPMLDK